MSSMHSDLGLTDKTATAGGGCCGGSCGCGSATSETQQTISLAGEQDFGVSGMTCNNCVNHVTKAVSALDGVTGVRIDLNPTGVSTVHISSNSPINAQSVRAAVEDAGYQIA